MNDPANDPVSSDDDTTAQRVGSLRGAGVGEVDVRRLGRVALAVGMVGLAVLAGVLFAAGARKNSQITSLRQQGVPVTVTITGCVGQLGGSGSNAAGYSCRGSYTLDGRRHDEPVPGTTDYRPGAHLAAVAVPGDPSLVAPAAAVAAERASARVYLLPALLSAALVALAVTLLVRTRRTRRRPEEPAALRPPIVTA